MSALQPIIYASTHPHVLTRWLKCERLKSMSLTIHAHKSFHMVAEHGFSPPRQCMSDRIAKHVADELIPLLREEIVDIVKTISHERIEQRIVEKIADVPVSSIQEQICRGDQEDSSGAGLRTHRGTDCRRSIARNLE